MRLTVSLTKKRCENCVLKIFQVSAVSREE